jgi:hypothetical protein
MKELKHNNDTLLHKSYLFIHSTSCKTNKALWTTTHLQNTHFQPNYMDISFKYALNDCHIWQLTKSVVAQHLSYLLISHEAPFKAGALPGFTRQGRHKLNTQETHYGQINALMGMSWMKTENCFVTSQV